MDGSVGGVIGLLVDSVELGPSWCMWMPEDASFNLGSKLDQVLFQILFPYRLLQNIE